MSTVTEIDIERLPPDELRALLNWIEEYAAAIGASETLFGLAQQRYVKSHRIPADGMSASLLHLPSLALQLKSVFVIERIHGNSAVQRRIGGNPGVEHAGDVETPH